MKYFNINRGTSKPNPVNLFERFRQVSEEPFPRNILLYPVTSNDTDFLLQLYYSTRSAELESSGWSEFDKAAFCKMQYETQQQHYLHHYPASEHYLIYYGDHRIGQLYFEETDREIRIIDIIIHHNYRRQGYCRYIICGIIEHAEYLQKPISLHVEQNNPILSFYKNLNFTKIANRGIYYFMERQPQLAQGIDNDC